MGIKLATLKLSLIIVSSPETGLIYASWKNAIGSIFILTITSGFINPSETTMFPALSSCTFTSPIV